ncbi:Hsp70 family protein, partial [Candidatus Kaiserbacteria bacterium]|nr:Hsp70 family protein [Candidatus Kaiserbacteria bacterium]
NKEQSIRIEGSSGLSEADIEKMKRDAEANAEADRQKKELVEVQNTADQLVYAAEKALKEHGEKVSEDIRKNVQEKIDALKSARNGSDAGAIKSAADALSSAMSAIGEAMSKSQPPPQDQKPSGSDQKPPEPDNK